MPKRKRDENQNGEQSLSHIQDQAIRLTASRFKAHFDNGVKTLTAQIKLARAFDRQKMTRRIKQAGSDPKKLERLNAELAVLKDLDTGIVASNYVLKQCVKTKKIRECSGFIAVFGEGAAGKLKGTIGTAEANVLGRLFKSNPVGEVLPRITRDIRTVLDVDGLATFTMKEVASTEEDENAPMMDEVGEFSGFSDSLAEEGAGTELTLDESEVFDDRNEEIPDLYEDRLAASSDSGSEFAEDGQDHDRRGHSMSITSEEDEGGLTGTFDHDETQSLPEDSDLEEGDSSLRPLMSENLSRSKTPSRSSLNPVLPALMNVGYYSGSDSASDFDPDKDMQVGTMAKIRKNRRGQRERQAIAEKKHGSRAKHLLRGNDKGRPPSAAQGTRRETGWDARRGAVGASEDSRSRAKRSAMNKYDQRNGFSRPTSGKASSSNISNDRRKQGKASVNAPEKPLHPSWEAARKKKLESAGGGNSFIGKKITFD